MHNTSMIPCKQKHNYSSLTLSGTCSESILGKKKRSQKKNGLIIFPVTSHQRQTSRSGHQESARCSFRCPLALGALWALGATPMRCNDGLPLAVDQLDVATILDGLNVLRDGSIGADAMLVHQLLGLLRWANGGQLGKLRP